jgi:hypothetical protein
LPCLTDKIFAQICTEVLTTLSAADWDAYSHLVDWLHYTDVPSRALKVRDAGPEFLIAISIRLAKYGRERHNEKLIALVVADMQDPIPPILEATLACERLHRASSAIARLSEVVH